MKETASLAHLPAGSLCAQDTIAFNQILNDD